MDVSEETVRRSNDSLNGENPSSPSADRTDLNTLDGARHPPDPSVFAEMHAFQLRPLTPGRVLEQDGIDAVPVLGAQG